MLNHSDNKIVLIADPAVLALPVHDNQEPLIDLIKQKDIAYGPPPLDPTNTNYTKVRKTIYQKLIAAQTMLPMGLKFCLYEGHRCLDLQQQIFEDRYTKLKKENPQWSHQQIFIETTKFASPITNLDDSQNIPPHTTGGAIDVYLIDLSGQVIDMGIHLDDTYEDLTGIYCKTDSQVISDQAKENRQIMSSALTTVGFVNYPTEYWHWSYGDRYWAYHKKQPFAIYNTIR